MDIKELNFGNLPSRVQHAIAIGGIIIVAAIGYWHTLQPKNVQLKALNAENSKLQQEVQQGKAVEIRYNEFKQELENLGARLIVLQTILPSEKEASAFLKSIQQMASSSELKINLFKPQNMVAHDFYSDWPVEIRLEGNYHGLGRFFEKISKAPRIVDVPTLTINNITDQTDSRRTIIATGMATTYVQGIEQALSKNPMEENR